MTDGEAFTAISRSGDDFAQVVALCELLGDYCLIDGLAINAYVEPVYTMDADFVLTAAQLPHAEAALRAAGFMLEDFPHSLNALRPGSRLRIQFTKDLRTRRFRHAQNDATFWAGACGSQAWPISCKEKSGPGAIPNGG